MFARPTTINNIPAAIASLLGARLRVFLYKYGNADNAGNVPSQKINSIAAL